MNHKINNQEWMANFLFGEMLLFGVLGKAFYAEPDTAWLQPWVDEDIFSEAPFGADQAEVRLGLDILRKWCQEQNGEISQQAILDLRVDFTRLFIGIEWVMAAPWESVYFNDNRMVFQKQTLEVRNWYRRYGLEVERLNKEPDDHIGLELAFVASLARLALQALEQGDSRSYESLIQAQREFLAEHPLQWAPAWCDLVNRYANTDFYRGMAHLARGALQAVVDDLKIEILSEVSR